MTEPLRTDPSTAGPVSEADRQARIEQLLLSGLDHYFAGRYEQAITIWTRVAFLERGHGRARAYIERARSALAERQRESEELLHSGVAAYHSGDLESARRLLTRALDQGGAHETALVFLQRLRRLEAAAEPLSERTARDYPAPVAPPPAGRPAGRWTTTALVSVAIAAAILVSAFPVASWLAQLPVAVPEVHQPAPEPLPIVRAVEIRLARAWELHAAGRPHAALELLEDIGLADPLRPEADRLRADIQRELLDALPPPDRPASGAPAR